MQIRQRVSVCCLLQQQPGSLRLPACMMPPLLAQLQAVFVLSVSRLRQTVNLLQEILFRQLTLYNGTKSSATASFMLARSEASGMVQADCVSRSSVSAVLTCRQRSLMPARSCAQALPSPETPSPTRLMRLPHDISCIARNLSIPDGTSSITARPHLTPHLHQGHGSRQIGVCSCGYHACFEWQLFRSVWQALAVQPMSTVLQSAYAD